MSNRTVVMPGVWALNAQTTIPTPPVSNTSYRNSNLSEQTIENGWGYSTIVNSADYNQFVYLLTLFLQVLEASGGVLPFCMTTKYGKNGFALGSDGILYISNTNDNVGNDPTIDNVNWSEFKPNFAGTADKLGSSTVGGPSQGIYLNNGIPTAMTTEFANQDLSNLSPDGEAVIKSNVQLVNEVPSDPVSGVLYCIPE